MIRLRALVSGLALTLALVAALALVALGGAHRFSKADDLAQAAALTYGAAALCGEVEKGSGAECPACHLAGAVILSEPSALTLDQEVRFVATITLPMEQQGVRTPFDPSHGLRGPPVA
ncbi:hypothetical protein [Stagnihabitans tardus]|uniref:Uncharacterized protein n=1 Tax=Stagnihabitans tardus TaxID=2699202 RepID=A0AAE4YCH6_9RHOB|nr:hypothetical protein [Stagnihabitans tardus]NBZ89499.1 hypothetical protein [Stagnihabitans tardus]